MSEPTKKSGFSSSYNYTNNIHNSFKSNMNIEIEGEKSKILFYRYFTIN